jgi:hypothetical protein
MRIRVLLPVAVLLACGPDVVEPPEGRTPENGVTTNHPPEIVSAVLDPAEPSVEDQVQLLLQVRDPERDSLDVTVTWMRNGVAFRTGPDQVLPSGMLSPGDRLAARVMVSDGEFEDEVETDDVSVRNLPPRVTFVRIRPEQPTATASIVADLEVHDPEGDDVELRFRWMRNGVEISGADGSVLEPGTVRRGQNIQVHVVPVDSWRNEGREVVSAAVRVENSAPEFTSEPTFELAGDRRYEYAVTVEDPDGDHPLRFELVRAPRGMTIDLVTGKVVWLIPEEAEGSHDIEIVARDLFGGEARQSYAIRVGLEMPPAAPVAPN